MKVSNKIKGDKSYSLPPKKFWFSLAEGKEIQTIFILASELPIQDITALVGSMRKLDATSAREMLTDKADVIESTTFTGTLRVVKQNGG